MNRLSSLNSISLTPLEPKSADPKPKKVLAKLSDSKADKAQTILTGALEVFTTQGYVAASMDRIAKTCGVSKPTLYTYFINKEGLFVALVQQDGRTSSVLVMCIV